MEKLQIRPGTLDIYTDKGDHVATVHLESYAEQLVWAFNADLSGSKEEPDEVERLTYRITTLLYQADNKDCEIKEQREKITELKRDLQEMRQAMISSIALLEEYVK